MMICNICLIEKEITNFSFRKETRKYRPSCNKCIYNRNKDKCNEKRRKRRLDNIEEVRKKERLKYNQNKDKYNKIRNEKRKLNPERYRELDRLRYERDKDKRKECVKRTYQKNRRRYITISNLRTKARRGSAPKWLTTEHKQQIIDIYKECSRLTNETKINYNVDHIIPINGETVCGLHVPWNLRIITQEENFKKSNKLLDEFSIIMEK